MKHKISISIIILTVICSCTKEKPKEIIPEKIPETAPKVVAEIAAPPVAKPAAGLATLEKLTNKASTRAHAESVWKNAVSGINFFKHDALRTHEMATALIQYESGSRLELKEKTLIIFDKDPGKTEKPADRVLLKAGELIGTTKRELWVFTNAGLVQLKASKASVPAKVTLSINHEKKLRVNIANGSAELIVRDEKKTFQKYTLAEKSDFEFKSKTDFDDDFFAKATSIKTTAPVELDIEAPVENAMSHEANYVVKGRLTDLGGKLLINGEPTEITETLTFSKSITLTQGTNLVVFQLIRSDASVKFYRKNIRYTAK